MMMEKKKKYKKKRRRKLNVIQNKKNVVNHNLVQNAWHAVHAIG
jgi:hypothetical protein